MQILKMWPFKGMLVNNVSSEESRTKEHSMKTDFCFFFGDSQCLVDKLEMANPLTAYVFLVDSEGRIRWRASGMPSEAELSTLIMVTDELAR